MALKSVDLPGLAVMMLFQSAQNGLLGLMAWRGPPTVVCAAGWAVESGLDLGRALAWTHRFLMKMVSYFYLCHWQLSITCKECSRISDLSVYCCSNAFVIDTATVLAQH